MKYTIPDMPHILPRVLSLIPPETKSLLDLGCGRGIIGAICRVYRNLERCVGVDIFDEYLRRARHIYDEIIKYDLRKFPLPFKNKEFEIVTCVEVVEHLQKSDALNLIKECERIAKKRVIITTPATPSIFHKHYYDGNPFQEHLSFISPKEFKKMGYKVYACGTIKFLDIPTPFAFVGNFRRLRYIQEIISSILLNFSLSSSQVCVKDL
jgi:ubiquinone/menaquinone biosynthesis C-methylase UbiE